jgi:phage terminase large subunit-like protein
MIPKEHIHETRRKTGTADALLDLYVKNKAGTINHIQFLSYEVSDDVIMGRELDVAWFDEECLNEKIYGETLMRTATTNGFVFTTFTPLDGFTKGIQKFIPTLSFPKDGIVRDDNGKETGRYVKHCGWNHAPHISDEVKEDIKRRYTGAELIARTEGIPTISAGQVYPYTREQMTCEPFKIPNWWPRAYGLDFGWHGEAVVWGAQDPDTGDIYIYSEYYAAQKPSTLKLAEMLEKMDKVGGRYMYGAADPSGGGRSADGMLTMDFYNEKGLNLVPGINSLAVLGRIQGMFESGQLKIFPHCQELLNQIAVYKFDEKTSKPARNQKDHSCDALKYLISVFDQIAHPMPDPDEEEDLQAAISSSQRNAVTGY